MVKACGASCYSRRGFALAEVIVSLFIVTMAIALISGLGQQVINLSKKSSQTGSILELRNMANAITRNTDEWLTSMRSSTHTQGIFAGCIPDPASNIATFKCPSTDVSYLKDNDLKEISENGAYHIASSPLVNNSGDLVAGSDTNPVFYTNEGRACKAENKAECPLKSTGYFLRANSSTDQDPGSVKFVLKIERNVLNVASASSPMKPQYITMDIGKDWKSLSASFGGNCPANTIKVGYLTNGKPSCINPTKPCADPNQIPIGIKSDGSTLCKALPDCDSSGGHVVLSQSGSDLMCSSASPCGANKLFLGYFAGTGEPMCSSSSIKCPSGQVQTGISISNGNMAAECEVLPTCTEANQRLSFNGTKFVCENATYAVNCTGNQVMTGIKSDGTPNCVDRTLASDDQSCALGEEMYGINSAGKIKCRPASGASSSSSAPAIPSYEGIVPPALYTSYLFTSTGGFQVPNPFPGRTDLVVDWSLCLKAGTSEGGYNNGACVTFEGINGWNQYLYTSHDTQNLHFRVGTANPGIHKKNEMILFMPNWNKWELKYRAYKIGSNP